MDAYAFGRLSSELPTELLSQGGPGDRIRVLGRLQGPDHDLFVALQAPDTAALSRHLETLRGAGASLEEPLVAVSADELTSLLDLPPISVILPSFIAVGEAIAFVLLTVVGPLEGIAAVQAELGADAVAVTSDGAGRFLVELTGFEAAMLAGPVAQLTGAPNVTSSRVHYATGLELLPG